MTWKGKKAMDAEKKTTPETTTSSDNEPSGVDMDFIYLLMEQRQISAPVPKWG